MKSHQRKIFVKFGWNPLTIFQVENLQRSNHKPYMEIVPCRVRFEPEDMF